MALNLRFALGLLAFAGGATGLGTSPLRAQPPAAPFRFEALVDFADDALIAERPLTAADLDALMARLAALGISRVSWAYYADDRGGFLNPTGYTGGGPRHAWKNYAATYRELGNPLQVAVAAGHRHGLEVYAYFKPYETGPALAFPEGSEAGKTWGRLNAIGGTLGWIDPFVAAHPDLRIQRRTDDIPPGTATAAVHTLRLTKQDAAPTRITASHLQIWTSPDNFHYQPAPVKFTLAESVGPATRDFRDQHGRLLTRRGDPVRTLTLSGLNLTEKYFLVTTDFTDGPGDFTNSGVDLLAACDERDHAILGVTASGGTIWCPELVDLRRGGLTFDYGWGASTVTLDAPNGGGRQGFIAFARGRNATLPGALCETEPAVRQFWLACLDAMIAAGVDGVDFREESHSTHTDHPEDYGFNPAVLAAVRADRSAAEVRGDAYTDFLRACKARLARAGKRMRYNLQVDFFRPDPPAERRLAYPANIRFDWRRWVREGLMDEAILRPFSYPLTSLWDDAVARDMIAECERKGIPFCVNRYVTKGGAGLAAEVRRVQADGRFSGFIFYEVSDFIRFGPKPGECRVIYAPVLEAAPRR